jgi:hypothetical protein
MEANTKTVFNVLFKELIVLTKCETSDKDARVAIKQRYKKYDTDGAQYVREFDLDAPALAGHALPSVRESLTEDDAKARFDSIVPLLVVYKKLYDAKVAQCIVTPVTTALLERHAEVLDAIILDKALCAEVSAAVEGADEETVSAVRAANLSKGTDIMSIARDVSKTINIEDLMKNGMDPSSGTMQSMVSNVSDDIQRRISSGEVDQDQLMREATEMLSSFGGSGGLGDMLKTMMSMGAPSLGAPSLGAPVAKTKQQTTQVSSREAVVRQFFYIRSNGNLDPDHPPIVRISCSVSAWARTTSASPLIGCSTPTLARWVSSPARSACTRSVRDTISAGSDTWIRLSRASSS